MQFDLFSPTITAPSSATSPLFGQIIKLNRANDRCHSDQVVIGASRGMHAASLHCRNCNRFRGWLGAEAYAAVEQTQAVFGRSNIITIRTPRLLPGDSSEGQLNRRQ
jgi:hypothetical protein